MTEKGLTTANLLSLIKQIKNKTNHSQEKKNPVISTPKTPQNTIKQ